VAGTQRSPIFHVDRSWQSRSPLYKGVEDRGGRRVGNIVIRRCCSFRDKWTVAFCIEPGARSGRMHRRSAAMSPISATAGREVRVWNGGGESDQRRRAARECARSQQRESDCPPHLFSSGDGMVIAPLLIVEPVANLCINFSRIVPVEAAKGLTVIKLHSTIGHIQRVQRRGELLAEVLAQR
jgi:hypothetical protein